MRSQRTAFTLVELLVVIAIIGILVSLLMPAVQAAREAAQRASCYNNMKQVGLALHSYHDANGRLPMGWIGVDPKTRRLPYAEGEPGWGWASRILPFLEQTNVSSELIDDTRAITDPANALARETHLPVFRCPSDIGDSQFDLGTGGSAATVLARLGVANYVGMFGTRELEDCEGLPIGERCKSDGVFYHLSGTRFADIIDGTSNTFMVGERSSRIEHSTWLGVIPDADEAFARILAIADHPPNTEGAHLDDLSSEHPAGANFLYGDGSVRLIADSIDLSVYQALATRAGGEVVTLK